MDQAVIGPPLSPTTLKSLPSTSWNLVEAEVARYKEDMMDEPPKFAKVIAFGKEVKIGVHPIPLNSSDGPCATSTVADWILYLDVRGDGTVRARGENDLFLKEQVVEPPSRINWGPPAVAVEFQAVVEGGVQVLYVSFLVLAAEPRSTIQQPAEAVA